MCAPAWQSRPRGGHGAASALVVLFEGGIEGPADDEPAHLAGASPDLVELGVAQEAPHGVVIDVTIPTCHTKKSHESLLVPRFRAEGGKAEGNALGLCLALRSCQGLTQALDPIQGHLSCALC